MKLLAIGLALLLAGIAALFSDFNPATLFIGGAVCAFLGMINVISRPGLGPAVSAGDTDEAASLANIQNYGSADASAGMIDGP